MADQLFVAAQMQRACSISSMTYTQWRARGYIHSRYKSTGTGDPQRYDLSEVLAVAVMARLVDLGIQLSVAHAHTAADGLILRKLPSGGSERTFLLLEIVTQDGEKGVRSRILTERKFSAELQRCGGGVFVCVSDIDAEVRTALGIE